MRDDRLRLDKWLWFARFFKTRSLAADQVLRGEVAVNGQVVRKTAHTLKPGDVVAMPAGRRHRRAVRVLALAERRGPFSEAQALYEELAPPAAEET